MKSKWEESNFLAVASPISDGDNYQMWVVRMETYLEALDLWETIEADYKVPPLPANLYYSTNQSIEGNEYKKIKGKSLPICSCISNDFYANNVTQNNKGNLRLPQA